MDMFNGLDAAFKGMDNVNRAIENSALKVAMNNIAYLDKLNIDSLKYPSIPAVTLSLVEIYKYQKTNFDFVDKSLNSFDDTLLNITKAIQNSTNYNAIISSSLELLSVNLSNTNFFNADQLDKYSDVLSSSISIDLSENDNNEKVIEEVLNFTNEIISNVNSATDKDTLFEFLDNIKIYIYSKVNLSNTLFTLYSIAIGLITNHLSDLTKQETTPQVNVSNNTTVSNNTIVINFNLYGKPLTIDDIKIGEKYICSTIKNLKTSRNLKSKTIISIPVGTSFKVLRKYNNWGIISVNIDGIYYEGYVKLDDLYNLVN